MPIDGAGGSFFWVISLLTRQRSHVRGKRSDLLIMRRRDRARLFRLSVLDAVILLALGGFGMVGLIYWPHLFVTLIAVPIALILLYVILRG